MQMLFAYKPTAPSKNNFILSRRSGHLPMPSFTVRTASSTITAMTYREHISPKESAPLSVAWYTKIGVMPYSEALMSPKTTPRTPRFFNTWKNYSVGSSALSLARTLRAIRKAINAIPAINIPKTAICIAPPRSPLSTGFVPQPGFGYRPTHAL